VETDHPVYEFLFNLNPWILVPGALLLFFLARTLLHSLFLTLAQHIVNGVRRIIDFLSRPGLWSGRHQPDGCGILMSVA
jgi:hypothetical protein